MLRVSELTHAKSHLSRHPTRYIQITTAAIIRYYPIVAAEC